MSDLQPTPVRRDYGSAPAQFCAYCQAPLDPFYYFCLRCATPYKPVVTVVGQGRPAPLSDAERIAKMAPQTWTVFWTFAAVVIAAALVSLPFGARDHMGVFYFFSSLAVLVTTMIFAVIHWRPLAAQFRQIGFHKWQAWAGVGVLIPLLGLNYVYHAMLQGLAGHDLSRLPTDLSLPVAIVVFCAFPAVAEEIAFRGLVQYWLDISLAPAKALVLGSAMFAALHFSLLSFPYLFLVGVLLALVRRQTGSLYPGMLIHFLHNLVVIALFRA
ncbi:MAG: CPBP family intramembrane metalloprotease [Phycisphaerales bacterium]|nr:CPBP family intramembrane metalloprotease [Phycisphaerales bacterium]